MAEAPARAAKPEKPHVEIRTVRAPHSADSFSRLESLA